MNLKKPYSQFLSISFFISYVSFGSIVYSKTNFSSIFSNPLYLLVFILGSLGPLLGTIIVYIINKSTLGGISGLIDKIKIIKNPKSIYLVPLFLIAHYGFAMILNNVYSYGSLLNFLYYFPVAFILLGSQEIGWRTILQPALEENKGFLKSTIATGLIWSLWFLPLIYIPEFFILPQFYLQFAIYLVGISFLLTRVYKNSGSILYSTLLSTLIFSLYPVILLKQSYMLAALAILEIILSSIYKDKSKLAI